MSAIATWLEQRLVYSWQDESTPHSLPNYTPVSQWFEIERCSLSVETAASLKLDKHQEWLKMRYEERLKHRQTVFTDSMNKNKQSGDNKPPDAQWQPDIIVGIDFGMTCTGELSAYASITADG